MLKKTSKKKKRKIIDDRGKKRRQNFSSFFLPRQREKGLVIKSRLEDSFVWKPLYATKKEKKTQKVKTTQVTPKLATEKLKEKIRLQIGDSGE